MRRVSTRGIPPSAWAARMRVGAVAVAQDPLDLLERVLGADVAGVGAGELERRGGPLAHRPQRAVVPDRGVEAVAPGAERGLDEHLAQEPAPRALLVVARRQHEAVHERGQAAHRAEARLGVHRPHLERAELRVRADVPPQERVVLDLGGRDDRVHRRLVVRPVRERARDVGARIAAEQLRPRGREAGVDPVPERRVRGQRLQHRQVRAHAVEGADRRSRGRACRRGRAARRSGCAAAARASGRRSRGSARRRRAAPRRTGRPGGCRRRRAWRPPRGSPPRSGSSERVPSIALRLIGDAVSTSAS